MNDDETFRHRYRRFIAAWEQTDAQHRPRWAWAKRLAWCWWAHRWRPCPACL